jgi:hypothetical protein
MRDAFPDRTDDAFLQEMLTAVNSYRAKHGAPPVTLDPQLVEYAKSRAAVTSTEDGLSHGHTGLDHAYGENLSWSAASSETVGAAGAAAASWYDEIKNYDFAAGGSANGKAIGHFTQLVWKGCSSIGAGRVAGRGGDWWETYIAVDFSPAGNMPGGYLDNVAPPQS